MINRHPGVNRANIVGILIFGFFGFASAPNPSNCQAADESRKVAWREDLGQAQAEAKSRDLLLWIQFSGPWCINCRRMDRSAFVHPSIVAKSDERFVPVKIRSDEYESLAQNLGLTMLPSTVIVRPNGEVVDKLEGYAEPEVFEKFLATVLNKEGRSAEQVAAKLKAKIEKDSAVALAGYDPVTLLQDQKLIPGRDDLVVEHDGKLFRFANEAARDTFLRKPDSYAPINGGRCPVSQVDRGDFLNGDPRWGVVYNGHLYLFKDRPDRDQFAKDPERYAGVDPMIRASCPHCRERAPLARRITSRFSNTFVSQVLLTPNRLSAAIRPAATPDSASSSATMSDRLASFLSLDSILRR